MFNGNALYEMQYYLNYHKMQTTLDKTVIN